MLVNLLCYYEEDFNLKKNEEKFEKHVCLCVQEIWKARCLYVSGERGGEVI